MSGVVYESGHEMIMPVSVQSDNQSALAWVTSHSCRPPRVKHISETLHFVRDTVKSNHVVVEYVPSSENDADNSRKPVQPSKKPSGSCRPKALLHKFYLPQLYTFELFKVNE